MPSKVLMGSGTIMKCFGTRINSKGKNESVYTNDGINWQKVKYGRMVPNGYFLCKDGIARALVGKSIYSANKQGKLLITPTGLDVNLHNMYYYGDCNVLIGIADNGVMYYTSDYTKFIKIPKFSGGFSNIFKHNIDMSGNIDSIKQSYISDVPSLYRTYLDLGKYCDLSHNKMVFEEGVDSGGNTYRRATRAEVLQAGSYEFFYRDNVFSLIRNSSTLLLEDGNTLVPDKTIFSKYIIVNHGTGKYATINYDISSQFWLIPGNNIAMLQLHNDNKYELFVFKHSLNRITIPFGRSIYAAIYSYSLEGFLAIFQDITGKKKQGFSKYGIKWEFSDDNIILLNFSF